MTTKILQQGQYRTNLVEKTFEITDPGVDVSSDYLVLLEEDGCYQVGYTRDYTVKCDSLGENEKQVEAFTLGGVVDTPLFFTFVDDFSKTFVDYYSNISGVCAEGWVFLEDTLIENKHRDVGTIKDFCSTNSIIKIGEDAPAAPIFRRTTIHNSVLTNVHDVVDSVVQDCQLWGKGYLRVQSCDLSKSTVYDEFNAGLTKSITKCTMKNSIVDEYEDLFNVVFLDYHDSLHFVVDNQPYGDGFKSSEIIDLTPFPPDDPRVRATIDIVFKPSKRDVYFKVELVKFTILEYSEQAVEDLTFQRYDDILTLSGLLGKTGWFTKQQADDSAKEIYRAARKLLDKYEEVLWDPQFR